MSRCVHIFGGIRTQQRHYKHAIDVYLANQYTVHFYPNRFLRFAIPSQYKHTVNKALANDQNGHIIHTNSGGFWTALSYHTQTKNNQLFICESGPFKPDTPTLIKFAETVYKVKCPAPLRNYVPQICALIGIYPHDVDPQWATQIHRDITTIPQFISMTNTRDPFIDRAYLQFIIDTIKKYHQAEQYLFDSDAHHNVSKTDVQRYQTILQNHINSIPHSSYSVPIQILRSRPQSQTPPAIP